MKSHEEIFTEAFIAAEKAGEEWMKNATIKYKVVDSFSGKEVGELLDCCGNAWIRGIDKRSKFFKWYVKEFCHTDYDKKYASFAIKTKYFFRQEMGLHVAMMNAACKVLNENSIKCYVYSYID